MKTEQAIETVQKTVLSNGLTIVTEKVDSVKSVSAGIWVKTGSRNETEKQAGITHFLEHMLFKGTESRSSYDIAMSMESVGGYLNAFTSSEYTCYYSRCLHTKLDRAINVLSDMILNPSFPEEELEKEKKVVIEEMKMYRDSPNDYLYEAFSNKVFENHNLGRPIIGYEYTVNAFSRQDLYDYMQQRYQPQNLLVSIAGNVNHEKVVGLIDKYFGHLQPDQLEEDPQNLPDYKASELDLSKDIEQTHLILGRRALHYDHQDKYRLLLANTVLGGGMSSRLHQNVREKYGYCYSISTFNQSYRDTGIFGIYVGTDQEYVSHVQKLIEKELRDLQDKKIPEQELSEAKAQLKGKLMLSLESMSNRMSRLAKSELYFNRYITLDELVEKIDEVQAEQVKRFAQDFFNPDVFSKAVLHPE